MDSDHEYKQKAIRNQDRIMQEKFNKSEKKKKIVKKSIFNFS